MKTLVAIPMKDLGQAKSRFSPMLDAAQRQSLVLSLFDRTLHFFRSAFPQFDLVIVTASEQIAARALATGAQVLREDAASGLNAASGRAAQWAVAQGYQRLVMVPADIPVLLSEEVEQMLALSEQYEVAIAEAHDGGTNMLLLSPPREFPFEYGLGSALRHEVVAAKNGFSTKRCYLPFIGHDLDTPADCLVLLQQNGLQHEDAGLLRSLRLSGVGAVTHSVKTASSLRLFALHGIPEIRRGDDLGALIVDAMSACGEQWQAGDIVVLAQKIVSKAEGRTRRLSDITPCARALEIAAQSGKDARKVQAILDESAEILRVVAFPPDGLVIARHRDGWVCANAAIDESNVGEDGVLLLLPENSDASARRIADTLRVTSELTVGVVITDTFGRPWRRGQVNVAIGVANVPTVVSWIGQRDAYGRKLQVSEPAFADEIAAATGLLMGKDSGTPVIVVRGLAWELDSHANAKQFVRPVKEDLFL